jgi:hypothetical protein
MKFRAAGNELALSQQSKLLIYEGSDGKMKAEVVTYIPDQANTQDKFSGIIIVEDWAGNSIARYGYQKNQSAHLNGAQSSECIKIDWYLCDVTETGATYNCEYLYTEYIGSCDQTLEPPGEEYIEIEKRRYLSWTVYSETTPYGNFWWVTAFDTLVGKGGVFTRNPIPRGSAISFMAPYNWREDSHTGDYTGSVANSDVTGTLLFPGGGGSPGTLEKQKIWYYSDVF